MSPWFGSEQVGRMRRVLERVIARGDPARLDGLDFAMDRDHGVTKPVELGLGFALGRFDHERAGHRPRNRRGMETVIHEPFGHILHSHRLEWAEIQDAFVGDVTIATPVEHRVVGSQPGGDVIGVQDRHPRGLGQTVRAHRRDVHPRDRQNPRAAPGGTGHRATSQSLPWRHHGMRWQKRGEVRCHADRTHARTPAAVGNAERLVQVQMTDVGTDIRGSTETDLGIHIGAIHVDLTAPIVNDPADFSDVLLEYAMGRWVCDHERGELIRVLVRLASQVTELDVPLVITGHRNDPQPGHDRAGRIRAVRRRGDEADIATRLAPFSLPCSNNQQTRVFPL